LTSFKTILLS